MTILGWGGSGVCPVGGGGGAVGGTDGGGSGAALGGGVGAGDGGAEEGRYEEVEPATLARMASTCLLSSSAYLSASSLSLPCLKEGGGTPLASAAIVPYNQTSQLGQPTRRQSSQDKIAVAIATSREESALVI